MPRGTEVPVTPGVLSWAVEESGYTDKQLAAHIGVSLDDLASWKRGDTRPTLTPLKKLATKLHRQFATFLLPAPPKRGALRVQFRSIGSQPPRELSPMERRLPPEGASPAGNHRLAVPGTQRAGAAPSPPFSVRLSGQGRGRHTGPTGYRVQPTGELDVTSSGIRSLA